MRKQMWVWGFIVIGFALYSSGCKWGVVGFFDEFDDEHLLNLTELSNFQSVASYGDPSAPAPLLVGLTLIQGAASSGAVCLDGTLPGYHIHRGYGSGANSWLIQLEGGGWCNTVRSCVYRKTTRRGSSKFMEKQLAFTGILSNKPEENPARWVPCADFFNWNRVKVRYCDGASFTGDGEDKARVLVFVNFHFHVLLKLMLYLPSNKLDGSTSKWFIACLICQRNINYDFKQEHIKLCEGWRNCSKLMLCYLEQLA